MTKRTENEMKAYIDGYNACFEQFKKCLDMSLIKNRKATDKMELFVKTVNDILNMSGKELNNERSNTRRIKKC